MQTALEIILNSPFDPKFSITVPSPGAFMPQEPLSEILKLWIRIDNGHTW